MDISFTIAAILPLFIIVLAGMGLRMLLKPTSQQTDIVNKVVFHLLLPCQLFKSAMEMDLSAVTDPGPYVYMWVLYSILTWIMIRIARRAPLGQPQRAAFVHSVIRPNVIFLGVPVAKAIYGGMSLPAELMCVAAMPLANVLGVLILSSFSADGKKPTLMGTVKAIAKNPLIIGLVAGLICGALNVKIPDILYSPLSSMSSAASTVGMMCIGFSLELKGTGADNRTVFAAAALRLLALPLIAATGAAIMGIRGIMLFAVYIAFAVPTAANNGLICASMGADENLANKVTLLTTLLSSVTLILGISLLQILGLI